MTGVAALGVALSTRVLADDGPQNTGPDFGKASPSGLIVTVLLLIAVFGLVWSMNRHLKRLPKSFDDADTGRAEPGSVADPDSDAPVGADPDLTTGSPAEGSTREPDEPR